MSRETPRFDLPFPDEFDGQWDAIFESFALQLDAELFALHEDRNLIMSGGGTVSWDGETLTWDASIVVASPTHGVLETLPAGSQLTEDGQFIILTLARGPTTNVIIGIAAENNVSIDGAVRVLAYRSGTELFLEGGGKLDAGDVVSGITGAGGVDVKDEGILILGGANGFDFAGGGVTATNNGDGTVTVTVPGGGGATVDVRDEGNLQGAATTLDFVGDGIVASFAAGTATITLDIAGVLNALLAVRPQTATLYLANAAGGLITSDPTVHEVAAGTASDDTQFTVLAVYEVVLPAEVVQAMFAVLEWTSQITTGAGVGSTKWMISDAVETPGSAPTGSAVDVTDVQVATVTKEQHSKSGLVDTASVPAGGTVRFVLAGKPAVAAEVLTATVFDEARVEVTY